MKKVIQLLWNAFGWKLEGIDPKLIGKKIYVVVPHTSNWDFPVGFFLKVWLGLDVRWIAKSSLFKWPFNYLFKAMGGIPVNRTRARNFVPTMISLYNSNEKFSTAIAPEGTRKKVEVLKSGYYRIATGANIPIIYTKFDWKNKVVHFGHPRMPLPSWNEEAAFAKTYFKNTQGCIPEKSFGYPFEN